MISIKRNSLKKTNEIICRARRRYAKKCIPYIINNPKITILLCIKSLNRGLWSKKSYYYGVAIYFWKAAYKEYILSNDYMTFNEFKLKFNYPYNYYEYIYFNEIENIYKLKRSI